MSTDLQKQKAALDAEKKKLDAERLQIQKERQQLAQERKAAGVGAPPAGTAPGNMKVKIIHPVELPSKVPPAASAQSKLPATSVLAAPPPPAHGHPANNNSGAAAKPPSGPPLVPPPPPPAIHHKAVGSGAGLHPNKHALPAVGAHGGKAGATPLAGDHPAAKKGDSKTPAPSAPGSCVIA
eukprot:PhF_6_TR7282/c0_g1_i1/m.10877